MHADADWTELNRVAGEELARLAAPSAPTQGQSTPTQVDLVPELHHCGIHTIRDLLLTGLSDRPLLVRSLERWVAASLLREGGDGGGNRFRHTSKAAQALPGGVEETTAALFVRRLVARVARAHLKRRTHAATDIATPLGCPTGCVRLDAALGGHGWPAGMLSCVSGEAGAGKTLVALQSLVACVVRDWSSNVHACYIVAEDSPARRLAGLAEATAARFGGAITAADILRRISIRHVKCCDHFFQACAELRTLHARAATTFGLFVLDSIAALVAGDPEERRGQSLARVAAELLRLAVLARQGATSNPPVAAVLVTNQVRFRPSAAAEAAEMGVVGDGASPALGVAWASSVQLHLLLARKPLRGSNRGASRWATVLAAPHIPPIPALGLEVRSDGIFCTDDVFSRRR